MYQDDSAYEPHPDDFAPVDPPEPCPPGCTCPWVDHDRVSVEGPF